MKLEERAHLSLVNELNAIHQKLQAIIFEKGFDEAVEYLVWKIKKNKDSQDSK